VIPACRSSAQQGAICRFPVSGIREISKKNQLAFGQGMDYHILFNMAPPSMAGRFLSEGTIRFAV
jgi:hypothetical protein